MGTLSVFIAEALFGGIVKSIGGKIAETGMSKAKAISNKILIAFNDDKIVNDYVSKAIHKIFVFRTMTGGDEDVYLDDIYHPMTIVGKVSRLRKVIIKDRVLIDDEGCSAIVGLAGQGKTTIMRKLFLEELVRGERLPFFITLRQFDYTSKIGCEDILLDHLNSNGIQCEISDVINILKTKKVIFYWDGFDEIAESQRNYALKMISSVYDKYNCSSLVTTRPDTEITRHPGVFLYGVGFLSYKDVCEIIKKTVRQKDAGELIINAFKTKRFLRATIRTPILVDVLIVTSPSLSDEPNSIGDYYDQLFSALIFRHDWNKNFKREKKTTLTNKKLEECFSLFSFFSLMESRSDFTLETMHKIFEKVCKIKNINLSEEHVCADIVDGTNLITRDGYNNYIYIHRTIQEYFSAKCISMFGTEQKQAFLTKYAKVELNKINPTLMSMLKFIDQSAFYSNYLIPLLEQNDVFLDGRVIVKDRAYVAQEISQRMIGIDDSAVMSITNPEHLENNGFKNLKYINFAAFLTGLKHGEDPTYDYLFDREDKIIEFSRDTYGKEKFTENVPGEISLHGLKWIEANKLREILPDFDEGFINAHYHYYLSLTSALQKTIDEEYLKKLESDGLISNMLDDMEFK
ncbi:NACHT domain-containing protein [Serratia marcescens]|nr:NACHT domain-containing protein [Serratia marcescens]HBH7556308.1 NACHT domain-containing protein [Serratia marcescens]HEJ0019658.1 NACHT domain-containing protein [Serratia marcescens]